MNCRNALQARSQRLQGPPFDPRLRSAVVIVYCLPNRWKDAPSRGRSQTHGCVLEVSACQSDPSAVLEPVGARRPMSLSLKSGAQGSLPIFHFVRSFRCRKQANQWKIDRRWCQATATIQRPSAGPAITPPAIGWDRIHESMRLRDFRGLSLAAESDPNALLAPAGLEHPVALSLGL